MIWDHRNFALRHSSYNLYVDSEFAKEGCTGRTSFRDKKNALLHVLAS